MENGQFLLYLQAYIYLMFCAKEENSYTTRIYIFTHSSVGLRTIICVRYRLLKNNVIPAKLFQKRVKVNEKFTMCFYIVLDLRPL